MKVNKIVEDVVNDYNLRREARKSLEMQWQLNINFMMGNQYSYIASNGSVREDEKQYFWKASIHRGNKLSTIYINGILWN